MRWTWIAIAAVALVGIAGASTWALTAARLTYTAADAPFDHPGDAAKGALIFAAGDCASCHASPGQSDRYKLGGGLALASPYGTFRAPNISPDPEDGIGRWQASDLANALLTGVSPRREHYYPAFPYVSYAGLTASDVNDLYAYLHTLQPVAGKAPPHDLSLVFKARPVLGVWKALFMKPHGTVPRPFGDAVLDRGAYLVEAAAHCAECHSPRNALGAIKSGQRFSGGKDPEGVGFIPNITPARIGHWSERAVVEMLTTGRTPDHGFIGSSMVDVVTNTATLPLSDREAIARYVKQLPSRPTQSP
jgi:mono/diheme cytochrome c family protein